MKYAGLAVIGLIIIIALGVVVWQKAPKSDDASEATLSGTVTYRERIALLPGSVVTVQLEDTSIADAPAVVLAETEMVTEADESVPLAFILTYDPADIVATHAYAVSARITQNGQVRWISDTHTPVLTNDAPGTDIEIILVGTGVSGGSEQGAPPAATLPSVPLVGTSFRLVSFGDATIPAGTNYTVTFAEDQLSAKFCNTMSGAYTMEHEIVRAPQMISTLMACSGPADPMRIESAFGQMVAEGAAVLLVGTTLTLADTEGTAMTFVAQ